MALPASDNFNRNNENPLAGNWTKIPNCTAFALKGSAADGWLGITGFNWHGAYWNADVPTSHHKSKIMLYFSFWNADGRMMGPAVRCSTTAATFYAAVRTANTNINVIAVVAGTTYVIGSVTNTFATNEYITLSVSGNILQVYKNDSLIYSVADRSWRIPSGGRMGTVTWSQSGGEISTDNWSGDNVTAPTQSTSPIPYSILGAPGLPIS